VRPDLPTGTVTFVFTDVEGSTSLLNEHGMERARTIRVDRHHLGHRRNVGGNSPGEDGARYVGCTRRHW
jgi:hypothetical protein